MSPIEAGLLAMIAIGAIVIVGLVVMNEAECREKWYEEGFRACLKLHRDFEITEDDKLVVKHLKSALKAYIKAKGYQRKGDIKRIQAINDFEDLKNAVWEICERDRI